MLRGKIYKEYKIILAAVGVANKSYCRLCMNKNFTFNVVYQQIKGRRYRVTIPALEGIEIESPNLKEARSLAKKIAQERILTLKSLGLSIPKDKYSNNLSQNCRTEKIDVALKF